MLKLYKWILCAMVLTGCCRLCPPPRHYIMATLEESDKEEVKMKDLAEEEHIAGSPILP